MKLITVSPVVILVLTACATRRAEEPSSAYPDHNPRAVDTGSPDASPAAPVVNPEDSVPLRHAQNAAPSTPNFVAVAPPSERLPPAAPSSRSIDPPSAGHGNLQVTDISETSNPKAKP
ncbi:MAG TPA: hypothetical protein VHM70_23445 [Polyangiaceae bacterium]|jgi:hypothetical protein|nr:hypothetical protein [Polyangiaceae bacterium]